MADRRKGLLLSACVSSFLFASFIGGAAGDVPDGVVYTDLHTTVQKGNEIVLKCEFYGAPIAVYWKKGDDPESGTDLISWVYEEEISGSCVNNEACHMADDYSLVIADARIADQGRYICRVSNYLGILIHNYTDVKVIAPPNEPYPLINECAEKESSGFNSSNPCKILTNATIIITCSVMNYYPELDLFFLHGSQKMTDILLSEKTNIDETKNKSISIKASASETPYVCVASGIPGSKDQTAATIFVESSTVIPITRANERPPTPSTSNTATTKISTGNRATKIVVPIFIILVIGAVAIFAFLWWKHRRLFCMFTTGDVETGATTSDPKERIQMVKTSTIAGKKSAMTSDPEERIPMVEKATIAGELSFYELWALAYETPRNEKMKVHHALVNLGIKNVPEEMTAPDIYALLCEWKDKNKKGKHLQLLQSALKEADFESRWVQLCEQRRFVDVKIPGSTLEQIILDIQSCNQIQQFFHNLLPGQYVNIKGGSVEKAVQMLRDWSKSPFKENPFALLSLALERCECSPVAQTFFAGTVSFFELWLLSRTMARSDVDKMRGTLTNLELSLGDGLPADEVYHHLCCWKVSDTTSYQGKPLRDALERADFKEGWKDIKEARVKKSTQVSENTLEHILRHIEDPPKINKFLHKLTLANPHTCLEINSELKNIIREARVHLNTWMKQQFDENPIILLSHALEKTGCSPVDRSFFKVPSELITNITKAEVQGFVDYLTIRHIKTLAPFLDIGKHGKTVNAIHEGNKDTIFNTEAMITEWIEQVECSNYEKRWRLNQAIAIIRRQDLTDYFGQNLNPQIHLGGQIGTMASAHSKGHTMKRDNLKVSDFFEDEFQRITTYLSSSQMKELFGIVGDDPRNELRAYVERLMADKSKQNWRDKLRKKLRSAELKVLIPLKLASNVYLCELLDVAFRLLLDDVYPLAEALSISGERLTKYRVDYTPDHLNEGTTAALMKFSKTHNNDRKEVCEALSKAGYRDIAQVLEYGHETSLADEFAVASRARVDKDVLVKISRNLGMSHTSNTETVLRDWKAMVHPPSYNKRTCLADAVFPVLGAEVADAILSGQYREDGSESSAVIQTISTDIESFKLSLVKNILGRKDQKKLQHEQGITRSQGACPQDSEDERQPTYMTEELPTDGFTDSTSPSFKRDHGESGKTEADTVRAYKSAIAPMVTQILGVTVAKSWSAQGSYIRKVLETWEEKIRKNPLSKDKRRVLSDYLLRAGFKQFAFEIMTGFIASPRNESNKKKTQDNKDKPANQDNQDRRDDREKHERRGEPKKEKEQDKEDKSCAKKSNQNEQEDIEKHEGRGKPFEHGKSTEPANQTETELEDKIDSENTTTGENPKHDNEVQVEEDK